MFNKQQQSTYCFLLMSPCFRNQRTNKAWVKILSLNIIPNHFQAIAFTHYEDKNVLPWNLHSEFYTNYQCSTSNINIIRHQLLMNTTILTYNHHIMIKLINDRCFKQIISLLIFGEEYTFINVYISDITIWLNCENIYQGSILPSSMGYWLNRRHFVNGSLYKNYLYLIHSSNIHPELLFRVYIFTECYRSNSF